MRRNDKRWDRPGSRGWGGRGTNEKNNTGEKERRGKGGRRKGRNARDRWKEWRVKKGKREKKGARMGFNKSLLIKMADWSGINGRFRHFLLLSIVLIRIRARIFHTLLPWMDLVSSPRDDGILVIALELKFSQRGEAKFEIFRREENTKHREYAAQ